jgi:hypothetical protein
LREGRNVFLHRCEVQGLQKHCGPLAVGTHGASDREENDGEGDEYTEDQTEGIEELGI